MHGIEGEQMGGGGCIASGIVHVHQLNAGAAPEGPEHQAANAAEAVDSDFHHCCELSPDQKHLIKP
jgi:hypothetical protein